MKMKETYFELPVYSCNQKEFEKHVTEKAEKVMANVTDCDNGFWQEQLADEIEINLIPVRFNELVGCIEVCVAGSQLSADYWYTDKKRIVIGSKSKGTIRLVGKVIECHYTYSKLSSSEIFEDFRSALEYRVSDHPRLKNRFIDYFVFDRCGPFIDWRRILGL